MRSRSVTASAAFSAAVAAALNSCVQAAIALAAPPGLANGDKFRFLFVTRTTTSGDSPHPTYYDAVVTADAGGATYNGSTISWKAVVSAGSTVTARTNVGGFGSSAGVYLVDGTKIAHDMGSTSGGLWSNLLAAPNIQIDSTALGSGIQRVWTGSNSSGLQKLTFGGLLMTLGESNAGVGNANSVGAWLEYSLDASSTSFRLFGVSQEFTYVAVPAPATIVLLSATGLIRSRRLR